MRHLILIRHSQSRPVPELPQDQWGLTAEGKTRCQPLAEQLRPYQLPQIFASHEVKAQQTAALTAEVLGIPWEVRAGFEEQGGRRPPYLSQEAFKEAVQALFAQPQAMVFGTETGEEAQQRFTAAVNQLLADYPTGNVAVVTHGRVLTLFLARYTAVDPLLFWQSLTMPCFVAIEVGADVNTYRGAMTTYGLRS